MYDNEYLAHHGIKGQKWGVRRYQNSDGTLTALGKRRASNKDIKQYEKSVYKSVNNEFDKKYGGDLNTLKTKADKKYDAYVKKHGLLSEDDDAEAFWEDYDKRHRIYDKASDMYDDYNALEYKIDMEKGREVSNRMVERFGQERMDKFKKSRQTKTMIAAGVIAAPLIIVSLPVTVPLIAVTAISEKKKGLIDSEKKSVEKEKTV